MKNIISLIGLCLLGTPCQATGISPLASTADLPCLAENDVRYNPQYIFDEHHACYPQNAAVCPAKGSVCANIALVKLANFNKDQDMLWSSHRGLWMQTWGSKDPAYQYSTAPAGSKAPAQNTDQALKLSTSFATSYPVNKQGKNYGAFLHGRLVEIDVTTAGNDRSPVDVTPVMDHYLTTANATPGTINAYLVDESAEDLDTNIGSIETRDLSSSPMLLSDTPVSKVTKAAVVDSNPDNGILVFHDIKVRHGDIQCQTSALQKGTPDYDKYACINNDPAIEAANKDTADIQSAEAMYDAGGTKNVVIKTTDTYDEIIAAFTVYKAGDKVAAAAEMRKFLWQPHVTKSMDVQRGVQHIHDWLVNAAKSIVAWEMNIYRPDDKTTNTPFCVTKYTPPPVAGYPYGKVEAKTIDANTNLDSCQYGPYKNMLDYLRQNTANPNYFGFSAAQVGQHLYSGNRANLWLLDTAAAEGTTDRYYRWQILGSEPGYDMSDAVQYLSYPYTQYSIMNGDRLDTMYQAIQKHMYTSSITAKPSIGGVVPRRHKSGDHGGKREVLKTTPEVTRDVDDY